MALSEIYVDPSIAADSGTGTDVDPYGDLEFALEETDWDAVNGIRVNIMAGTDEILAAKIDVAMADTTSANKTVAWTPALAAALVFEGYTATAGDGGIGGISGGGSVSIFDTSGAPPGDFITFKNLHLHNSGAAKLIFLGDRCTISNCELDTCSNATAIEIILYSQIINCYVHDITSATYCIYALNTGAGQYGNFIEYGGQGDALRLATGWAYNNIIIITGNGDGIVTQSATCQDVFNNSIYSSNNGTGDGIQCSGRLSVRNNLVEGFSGAGGAGIQIPAATDFFDFSGNAVYDCTTAYEGTARFDFTAHTAPDNETLTASPFTAPGTGNFSPVDTGNVKEGSKPNKVGGTFL